VGVHRYPQQPAHNLGVPPEAAQVTVGFDKYLLRYVIGIVPISSELHSEIKNRPLVAFDKILKSGQIASAHPFNEFTFVTIHQRPLQYRDAGGGPKVGMVTRILGKIAQLAVSTPGWYQNFHANTSATAARPWFFSFGIGLPAVKIRPWPCLPD
jgi:hypothetical protein